MASAGDLCKFKVSNSKIGKCIYMYMYMCVYIILTFFHMISREIYRGLVQNRFLNLSLISRFPI